MTSGCGLRLKRNNMLNITHLSVRKGVPARGYWDHAFLDEMLEGLGKSDRHVFIIPGKDQNDIDSFRKINARLSKYDKVLVFITSDEEGLFDINEIEHPDAIIYSQYGNGGFMFPLGYTTETRKILKKIGYRKKDMNWFFAGQVTHKRRELCVEQLRKLKGGELVETDGFGKGLSQEDYLESLSEARTAPSPSGAVSVDSFRTYEALEAGCIPIVDDMSPIKSVRANYWYKLFGGNIPFPVFTNYDHLPKLIDKASRYKNYNNKVFAWWINMKHQFRELLKQDLGIEKEDMVAVVPISPIKSHPDTAILEETIKSIRVHTDCPIVLTFDGVRKEQNDKEADYNEFISKMLWKINFEYENVFPIIFDKHHHQSGMMQYFLNSVDVKYILYVEQDTPLTPDRDIDWKKCKDYIDSGKANVIRFHFEEVIPEPHEHLMIGGVEDGFQKTVQWSQRPHLASQDMYRIIMGLFSDKTNSFIEDYIHGVLQDVWKEKGMRGWNKWKVWIYHPDDGIGIKRSLHTDGRAGAEKYDDKQTF